MSTVVEKAVVSLNEKLAGNGFDGIAKFSITDEGSIMIDANGVRAGDDDADVTISASADVFLGIMEGEINGMGAFMSGQIKVDGDMGKAMELAPLLG